MDKHKLSEAIRRAVDGGVCPAGPVPDGDSCSDAAFVRGQMDVSVAPAVLEAFLADLQSIPEMAELDRRFATTSIGSGISITLQSMARLILAQAVARNDVKATAELFADYIERNAATAIAVMAISGVRVSNEVPLGPDVVLVPMTSVPPSIQRGLALGQDRFEPYGERVPIASALITNFEFGPIFYSPPEGPSEFAVRSTRAAQHRLDEARLLFGILGLYPACRMLWVQSQDQLMPAGMTSAWQYSSSDSDFLEFNAPVPATEFHELAAQYFALDERLRTKMLHIPMDRLNRAGRERDLADRAIDLGIALEALLLHDTGDTRDRGELRFRLSLRGAWLLGRSASERAKIHRTLRKAYDLRSQAVHSGDVERKPPNIQTLTEATRVCQQFIRAAIDAQCRIEWNELVLGGDMNVAEIPDDPP